MPGLTGIAGVQAVVASRGFRPPAETSDGTPGRRSSVCQGLCGFSENCTRFAEDSALYLTSGHTSCEHDLETLVSSLQQAST